MNMMNNNNAYAFEEENKALQERENFHKDCA
jgi:hypothetical protein